MFVSAGRDLKFHSLIDPSLQLYYKPNVIGEIQAVSWAKDNGFLTFVTNKGLPEIISIRDPNNIKNIHTITSVTDARVIAFQRGTKRYLGIGAELGQVAMYDTKCKAISRLLQSTDSAVCCLDFNCDDKNMAVCTKTGLVMVYDVLRGTVADTFDHMCNYRPTAMRYHPSSAHILAIALEDGTVTEWDVVGAQKKFSAKVHVAAITGIVLVENSNLLLSVGIDNKFSIQDLNTRQSTFCCNQPYPLTAIDASFDGITVAIGTEYGEIYLYDIRQLIRPINKLKPHASKINKIVFENKLKEDFCDDSSEFLSTSTCESREEILETNMIDDPIISPKPNIQRLSEQTSEKNPVDMKFTSMSKNSSKVNVRQTKDNKDSIDKAADEIKREVNQNIRNAKSKLEEHIGIQVKNLEQFMVGEFRNMYDIIDEKFEYFTMLVDSRLFKKDTE